MPTRNVNLTKHFDKFVEDGVVSGRFGNASEVVREGLRLLEQREKEEKAWLKYLQEAAQEGIDDIERGDFIPLKSKEDIEALFADVRREALAELQEEARKIA